MEETTEALLARFDAAIEKVSRRAWPKAQMPDITNLLAVLKAYRITLRELASFERAKR